MPTVIWRVFSSRARVLDHHRVSGRSDLDGLVVRSADERPLPLQVDGDYIGEAHEAVFAVTPHGIAVVS